MRFAASVNAWSAAFEGFKGWEFRMAGQGVLQKVEGGCVVLLHVCPSFGSLISLPQNAWEGVVDLCGDRLWANKS